MTDRTVFSTATLRQPDDTNLAEIVKLTGLTQLNILGEQRRHPRAGDVQAGQELRAPGNGTLFHAAELGTEKYEK